jgi:hypothetical protein
MKKVLPLLFCVIYCCLLLPGQVFAQSTPVSVTASVPPKTSDFSFTFSQVSSKAPFNQGDTITYQITYGSYLYYDAPVTLSASWVNGTIQENPPSSEPILDYVPDSATNAYNNTSPVIDLVNQDITWNIPALKSRTLNQIVTFSLQTKNVSISNPITFTVSSDFVSSPVTLPTQNINSTYQYDSSLVIAPTPTATPSETTTPTSSPSPKQTNTPTPSVTTTPSVAIPYKLTGVLYRTITDSSIDLSIQLSRASQYTVLWGETPSALTNTLSYSTYVVSQEVLLQNLNPDTIYYVKIESTDASGDTLTSNIYEFKTAVFSTAPEISLGTIIVSSGDSILVDPTILSYQNNASPVVELSQGQPFNFKFSSSQYGAITKIKATIRNAQVLGASTQNAAENEVYSKMIEVTPGLFDGSLTAPRTAGNYAVYADFTDSFGNNIESRITQLKVVHPFEVFDTTGSPIDNAQVVLEYFNGISHQYEVLPPNVFPFSNPAYTDKNGEINYPLPQGSYKATITAIGYGQKHVEFVIGNHPKQEYPRVVLSKEPFNVFSTVSYYTTATTNLFSASAAYVSVVTNSLGILDLNAIFIMSIFIILTLMAFASRLHVPLGSLLEYLRHHEQISVIKNALGERIKGRVFDENTGSILATADVYLIDSAKQKIVGHTMTDANGDFSLLKIKSNEYEFRVMKEGYEPVTFHESILKSVELGGYLLSIKKARFGTTVFDKSMTYLTKLLAMSFEVLVAYSFLFEIAFGYFLGWGKVLPFLILSLLNLCIWIVHLSHLKSERSIF